MSKRQLRIFLPEEKSDLERFLGKELTLCLKNNSVFIGTAQAFHADEVVVKDKLLRKYVFAFHDIREIILEQKEIF